uniref:Uncharacterized protein n=1 Tax=Plectus sambesii TaxID=2011161 RepID=A0A914UQ78_9BILA
MERSRRQAPPLANSRYRGARKATPVVTVSRARRPVATRTTKGTWATTECEVATSGDKRRPTAMGYGAQKRPSNAALTRDDNRREPAAGGVHKNPVVPALIAFSPGRSIAQEYIHSPSAITIVAVIYDRMPVTHRPSSHYASTGA